MNAKYFFIYSFLGIIPVIFLAKTLLSRKRPFEYTLNIFGNVYNIVDGNNLVGHNSSQHNKSRNMQPGNVHHANENANNKSVMKQIDQFGHVNGFRQNNPSTFHVNDEMLSTADKDKIIDFFGIDKTLYRNISETLNEFEKFDKELRIPKMTMDIKPPSRFLEQSKNPCWIGNIFEGDTTDHECDEHNLICNMYNKVLNQTIDIQRYRLGAGIPWKLRCIPYFYLIGFPKCGTTDLSARISKHPAIIGRFKEFHFWSKLRWDTEAGVIETLKPYVDLFDMIAEKIRNDIKLFTRSDAITGDNSPSTVFFYNGEYGENGPILTNADIIKHMSPPTTKYICILRDPVERMISEFYYWHNEETAEKSKITPNQYFHALVQDGIRDFEHCLTEHEFRYCVYLLSREGVARGGMFRVSLGIYHVFLTDWIKVVGKDSILVIKMEELPNNLEGIMTSVFYHLDVKPRLDDLGEQYRKQILNKKIQNAQDERESMLPKTRKLLQGFYENHNKILRDILGDDKFNWGY